MLQHGEHLEKAHRLNAIVLDKTGTITRGEPDVTDIVTVNNGYKDSELLTLAASVEKSSEHSLGLAIVEHAKKKGIDLLEAGDFNAIPGHGIEASV